ncbi:ketopantoate reductase family protein [Streptococcus sobrinus]|uniref:ketopantoate reductase family protein n=1 Tax=Streptococcus sobrinus TaxID=1310 RepID=UPI0002E16ADA|nr:2-dehydropantoate 2-reductase N-terminal domain-containing protein [Streptococcus sobrinus]AWN19305.1 2-dehydropantoate 2-reductase [Streptococcus sobrinus]
MKILVVGLGVIGTSYGYLFQKAGHEVQHLLREDSPKRSLTSLSVQVLDGRQDKQGRAFKDTYQIKPCNQKDYDFIFVSVAKGQVGDVIDDLDRLAITGSLILACGIWQTRAELDQDLGNHDYILGYPVAGGNLIENCLTFCLFDHFMLESEEKSKLSNYQQLVQVFDDCQIKLEVPDDMLEWIWLHMAINAGVIAVVASSARTGEGKAIAENLMDSRKLLAQAVRCIRETLTMAEAKGVNLKNYGKEIWIYRMPICLSSRLMKRLFAKNLLSRKIMTLHSNLPDLLFICQKFFDLGKEKEIPAPNFNQAYLTFWDKLKYLENEEL